MWDKLTSADLNRIRTALDMTRAETLRRHAEELKNLEVKQADELQRLNGERAEIEMLDALIDNFHRTYGIGTETTNVDEPALIHLETFRKFAS